MFCFRTSAFFLTLVAFLCIDGDDTVERLKTDRSVSMQTIQRLCNILDCELSDIAECYPDKKSSSKL